VNPNDICGDEEFYQDTLRLVKLDKLVAEGKAKAAVTGEHPLWLQEKQDQLRGMNERLAERLPRDPKAASPANPQGITHVWDFHVNRLVPFQPVPPFDASKAPAPAQPTPSAKPADAKKP